ncbi:hypothetical protein CK203_033531 [Vitis vinifera]|uniref:Uncharacterized protein n=1 Tax=Vitis vinifera TaxID=29760 RepID=A0A438FLA8_VITVI|nr:hypothetical protein CK203_033531 [Vitis vinifera]
MKGEESSSKAEQGSKTKEAEQGAKIFAHLISRCENFAHPKTKELKVSPRTAENLWNPEPPPFISAMAKTRGGLSASPSSPTPRPQRAAMGAAPSPPVQAPAIPPSEGEVLLSADTPPGGHRTLCHQRQATSLFLGPAKRTRFSGPGEPSTHLSQSQLQRNLGFLWMPPEAIIRRPMIAGPPIEGNLDCRDRPSIPRPTLI